MPASNKRYFSFWAIALYALVPTAIVFFPFLFMMKFPVWSTDNLWCHIPNFAFISDALHQGQYPLWNPYILSGVDFTSSPLNSSYNPLHWLILLSPTKLLLPLHGLLTFCLFWFLGICGFYLFREEFQSPPVALFSAILLQLSDFSLWFMTNFALPVLFWTTVCLLTVWTMNKRKMFWSYLLLTFFLLMLLLSGKFNYTFGGMLIFFTLCAYRIWWLNKNRLPVKKLVTLILLAILCAGFIASIRLYPFFKASKNTNRTQHMETTQSIYSNPFFKNTVLMGIRLFNPEFFGVYYKSSYPVLQSLEPGFPGHTQDKGVPYFGQLAFLLILALCCSKHKDDRAFFLIIVCCCTYAWLVGIQPVMEIFKFLLTPVYHPVFPYMLFGYSFLFLAGHALRHLFSSAASFNLEKQKYYAAAFIVLLLPCIGITHQPLQSDLHLLQGTVIVSLLALLINQYRHKKQYCILPLTLLLIWSVYFRTAFKLVNASVFDLLASDFFIQFSVLFTFGFGLCLILLIFYASKNAPNLFYSAAGIALITIAGLLFLSNASPDLKLTAHANYLLSSVSLLRLMSLTFFVPFLWNRWKKNSQGLAKIFAILICLTLFECLSHQILYRYFMTDAFFPYEQVICSRVPTMITKDAQKKSDQVQKEEMQLYRVNRPHIFFNQTHFELNSNQLQNAGIRILGGGNSIVPQRYVDFIAGMEGGLVNSGWGGVHPSVRQKRTMQLLGCKYNFDVQKGREIISNALARFMVFYNFQVIRNDRKILKTLKQKNFDPYQTVLLEQPPAYPLLTSPTLRQADIIKPMHSSNNRLEFHLANTIDTIFLLNDQYHSGWRATLDGAPVEVMRANYTFMAVAIPKGSHTLQFEFHPQAFYTGIKITLFGICFLIGTALAIGLLEKNRPNG